MTVEYLGSYLLTVILALLALPVLLVMNLPPRQQVNTPQSVISFGELLRHPVFLPAVLFCAGGYGMMMFVMLASPLAMNHCGYDPRDAASVIQWHLLGMFAPSLLTGKAIGRFGSQPVALLGCILLASGCVLALMGEALWLFHLALLLVGIGWNLMYMGGSTLLSQVIDDQLRSRLQSLNEFVTYGVMTLTAGITGWFYHHLGWSSVLGTTLGLLLAVMVLAIISRRKSALL
jgi:predicted MFS family arabinose efflux permease